MSGRIGLPPPSEFHVTGDYLCISAPNRYRNAWRRKHCTQDEIIVMQRSDWPHLVNPLGIDIDFPTWDQVLVWPVADNGNA